METARGDAADGTQAALPLQTDASVTPEIIMYAADQLAQLQAQLQEQPTIRTYPDWENWFGKAAVGVDRLIAAAGDVDIKDGFGYTALQLAASRQLPGEGAAGQGCISVTAVCCQGRKPAA